MKIQLVLFSMFVASIMATFDISSEQNFDIPDSCEPKFLTDNWKDCANSLSTLIWNSHSWYDDQPITICKLKCIRKLKGHVSNFQWVWDAQFGCGEQTPEIFGVAQEYKIRKSAMKEAISQSIEHAFTLGKMTPNDFKC